MSDLNLARDHVSEALASLKPAKNLPPVAVRDFTVLSNNCARVVAEVSGENRDNDELVAEALQQKMGKLKAVAGSFVCLASNANTNYVTGIVAEIPDIRAVQDETEEYTSLSGNIYKDKENKLWKLQKSEAGKLMVSCNTDEYADELEALLQSCSSAVPVGSVNAYAGTNERNHENYYTMQASVEGGDYISFVNPETAQIEFGVAIAGVVNEDNTPHTNVVVLPFNSESSVNMHRELIVEAITVEPDTEDNVMESISGNVNIQRLVDYYRSVFQRRPAYFQEFEKRIRGHKFL